VTLTKQLLNAEGICKQTCPTNSIDNSTFYKCSMCPVECSKCSNISSNCTACNVEMDMNLFINYTTVNGTEIPNGKCMLNCPTGYYADQNTCKKCDESCSECEQVNYCTNCTMDYVNNKFYHFVNF